MLFESDSVVLVHNANVNVCEVAFTYRYLIKKYMIKKVIIQEKEVEKLILLPRVGKSKARRLNDFMKANGGKEHEGCLCGHDERKVFFSNFKAWYFKFKNQNHGKITD